MATLIEWDRAVTDEALQFCSNCVEPNGFARRSVETNHYASFALIPAVGFFPAGLTRMRTKKRERRDAKVSSGRQE